MGEFISIKKSLPNYTFNAQQLLICSKFALSFMCTLSRLKSRVLGKWKQRYKKQKKWKHTYSNKKGTISKKKNFKNFSRKDSHAVYGAALSFKSLILLFINKQKNEREHHVGQSVGKMNLPDDEADKSLYNILLGSVRNFCRNFIVDLWEALSNLKKNSQIFTTLLR